MFKQAATCDDSTDLQEYMLSPPTSPNAWRVEKSSRPSPCKRSILSSLDSLFKSRAHPALSRSTPAPPQGCVLSPLLPALLTHDCTPSHTSKLFIRLHNCGGSHQPIIRNESRYRALVRGQVPGCIKQDLSLSTNISSLAGTPHRHVYFLQKLRKAKVPPLRCTITSILASCIAAWSSSRTSLSLTSIS